MAIRPGNFPDWATNNPNGVVQPASADQATGWLPNEPAPAETMNWLQNTTSSWLRYLDEQSNSTVLASSLDFSTRLIGGGTFAYAYNSTTVSWSASAFVAIPSSSDASNTIPAGSISLPSGSVAYVTANMPFSTTATTTSGSTTLSNVLYGDMVTAGQSVAGAGIPANTTVQTVSSDGTSITLSNAATASASNVTVTFSTAGTLTVQVASSATFVPGPNTVIFARGIDGAAVIGVGSGQMLLRQGEAKILLGHGFTVSKSYTCGVAISANKPVYLSPGASGGDVAGTVAGQIYPLDCTSTSSQIRATFLGICPVGAAAGAQAVVVSQGIVGNFAVSPGVVYFGSATQAGIFQVGPPAATGQWIMPVFLAISASEVMLLPRNGATKVFADITPGNVTAQGSISAPKFISPTGFRERVCIGNYYNTNYPGGDVLLTRTSYSPNGGTIATPSYPTVFDAPGSIIAITATSDLSLNGAILFYLRAIGGGGTDPGSEVLRSNMIVDGNVGTSGQVSTNAGVYTIAHLTFAKGQYPVSAFTAYRGFTAYQNASVPFSVEYHLTLAYDA